MKRVTIAADHWLDEAAAASYARARASGMPAGLTDAGRTWDEQHALWKRQGHLGLAWHPDDPRANHMKGRAIDVPRDVARWLESHGRAHGWVRTIAAEWWHFEYLEHLDQHKGDDMLTPQQEKTLDTIERRTRRLDVDLSDIFARVVGVDAELDALASIVQAQQTGQPFDVAGHLAKVRETVRDELAKGVNVKITTGKD